jgi:hypothetical protein
LPSFSLPFRPKVIEPYKRRFSFAAFSLPSLRSRMRLQCGGLLRDDLNPTETYLVDPRKPHGFNILVKKMEQAILHRFYVFTRRRLDLGTSSKFGMDVSRGRESSSSRPEIIPEGGDSQFGQRT